jgi:hypothetical protein
MKYLALSVFPRLLFCAVCTLLLLGIGGCQRRDVVIAGVDVPVPAEMKEVADKGFAAISGFETGQASFEGKVEPGEIYNFYQEVMEARGWKPSSFFAGQKDQLAYEKDNKVLMLSYDQNPDQTTTLTILVGPNRPPK